MGGLLYTFFYLLKAPVVFPVLEFYLKVTVNASWNQDVRRAGRLLEKFLRLVCVQIVGGKFSPLKSFEKVNKHLEKFF